MDQFQVGDKVWCCASGEGVVTSISSLPANNFPITVQFSAEPYDYDYYTAEGQLYREGPRCLFFTAPDTTGGTTRPFVPKLIGKYVVVRCAVGKDILGVIEDEAPNWVRVDNIILQKEDIETLYEVSEKNLLED